MEEDRYSHITLFSTAELGAFYAYFRTKLEATYEFLTAGRIADLKEVLELLMVVVDTPKLAAQLNHSSQVSLTSMLEILMTKAAMWKVAGSKELRQVAQRTLQLICLHAKLSHNHTSKQNELPTEIRPVDFFVTSFQDNHPDKVKLFLSFLRIHLLNLFARRLDIGKEWLPVVGVLVSLTKRLNQFVLVDSVVTIVSWLAQRDQQLKQECLVQGLAYQLVGVIDQQEATPEFRKKCLKVIYLLTADDESAQKTLLQTELQAKALVFVQQHPFRGVEILMQPIIGMLVGYYKQEDIVDRIGGLEGLLVQVPPSTLEEILLRILVYGQVLKDRFSYSAAITQSVVSLAKHLVQEQNLGNRQSDRLAALCLKLIERYLVNQRLPEDTLSTLLREVLLLVCNSLNKSSSRDLKYQAIRTLTVLLKKDHLRGTFIPLCKSMNLRDRLPREVESQDISMVLVIDRLLWLFKDQRQMRIEDFVSDIMSLSANGKIDRAEQTSEKLSLVSDLIRDGGTVDVKTMDALINVLVNQQTCPVPSNSQQQQLYQQLIKTRQEALAAINAVYDRTPNDQLYRAAILNRLIRQLPAAQEVTETEQLLEILTKTVPKCPQPQQLDSELVAKELARQPIRHEKQETLREFCSVYCPEAAVQPTQQPALTSPQKQHPPMPLPKQEKPQPQQTTELTSEQALACLQQRKLIMHAVNLFQSSQSLGSQVLMELIECYIDSQMLSKRCGIPSQDFQSELLKLLSKHPSQVKQLSYKLPTFSRQLLKLWKQLHLDTHSIILMCRDRLRQEEQPNPLYLQLLVECLNARPDYEMFEQVNLPAVLNELDSTSPMVLLKLALLVSHTSKLKSIQQQYTLLQKFVEKIMHTTDTTLLAALLYALCGLTYENPIAQKSLMKLAYIEQVLGLADAYVTIPTIVAPATELISNLSLKSPQNIRQLRQFGVVPALMKLLRVYCQPQHHQSQALKQILRAIGNISIDGDVCHDIMKLQFMLLFREALEILAKSKNFEQICYLFDVLSNILAHSEEPSGKQLLTTVRRQGGLHLSMSTLQSFLMNADIVSCCLGCLRQLIDTSEPAPEVSRSLVESINNVLKAHVWNEKIVKKCFQIIGLLAAHKSCVNAMIDHSLPATIEEVVCQPHFSSNQALQTKFVEITHRLVQAPRRQEFAKTGIISCLCRSLRDEKQRKPLIELLKLSIDLVMNGYSTPPLNRSLAAATIDLLRHQNKSSEELVAQGLKLLTLIQQDLLIDKTSSQSLIDFSCYFLTRSKQIMYETYQLKIRDYLCLLSCLVSRSSLLKIEMGSQAFLSILENWSKIARAVEVQGLMEAIRLLIITIVNKDSSFPQNHTDRVNVQTAEIQLDTGYKCLLYRADQTNKQARIAVRKGQLIAYKLPEGSVKEKYHLPLTNIIVAVGTFKNNDMVFDNSIFYKAGGVFRKPPAVGNCAIIAGVHNNRAKFFQVEFGSITQKDTFLASLHATMLRANLT